VTSRTTIPAEAFWRTTLAAAGCNQFDYACSLTELRAVNSTAAASDKTFLRAVDATGCRKKIVKLASVSKNVVQIAELNFEFK
jgi:hypothetical protein